MCKSPDTSQIFTSLPEGSRAAGEGDQPNEVRRAKLDKGSAGTGAESHHPEELNNFTLDKEAVKTAQEDTQEAGRAGSSETSQAFLSISLLRLEMQLSSYGHRLSFPALTKHLIIMWTKHLCT